MSKTSYVNEKFCEIVAGVPEE